MTPAQSRRQAAKGFTRAKKSTVITQKDRLVGCLVGAAIGDALAMPAHWYYDPDELVADFGEIRGYEAPKDSFKGSFMGRMCDPKTPAGSDALAIIGDKILFGKAAQWQPGSTAHYHQGMVAGENTLDALVARLLCRSLAARKKLDADDYRNRYIELLTTPGAHNDTFAGSNHRVFFANRFLRGINPADCPGNDGLNVDGLDGLASAVPIIVAASAAAAASADAAEAAAEAAAAEAAAAAAAAAAAGKGRAAAAAATAAAAAAAATTAAAAAQSVEEVPQVSAEVGGKLYVAMEVALRVTRRYDKLLLHACRLADMLLDVLDGVDFLTSVVECGVLIDYDVAVERETPVDNMACCFIDGAFRAMLHFAYSYADRGPEAMLLASANAGGDNVPRGFLLGALLGAAHGLSGLPPRLVDGLKDSRDVIADAQALVDAFLPPVPSRGQPPSSPSLSPSRPAAAVSGGGDGEAAAGERASRRKDRSSVCVLQ